jgi:hypothetical protein
MGTTESATPDGARVGSRLRRSRKRRQRSRKGLLATVAAFAMALVLSSVTAVLPAEASVSYLDGTVTGYAGCNSDFHQMDMGGTFRVADTFPAGAWLSSRYQYWRVDGSTGQRIGDYYYSQSTLSWGRPGTVWLPHTELGGPESISQTSDLPTVTVHDQWGRLNVAVQVAVLHGLTWGEWSPYDTVVSYPTSNRYGFLSYNSMCVGSVT